MKQRISLVILAILLITFAQAQDNSQLLRFEYFDSNALIKCDSIKLLVRMDIITVKYNGQKRVSKCKYDIYVQQHQRHHITTSILLHYNGDDFPYISTHPFLNDVWKQYNPKISQTLSSINYSLPLRKRRRFCIEVVIKPTRMRR